MQYTGLGSDLLSVASNDNDDLLALTFPSLNLAIVRSIKREMRSENAETGVLLQSRKERRFFQEIIDAERYIVLRYFSAHAPESSLRRLKRYILDTYLFPRARKHKKS